MRHEPAEEPAGPPADPAGPVGPPADQVDAAEAVDVADPGEADPVDDTRRYPSTIGGLFYIAILAVFAGGLVLASLGSWRTGIRVSAGSLVVASALRLALPRRDAGMLAVRHRLVDAVVLAGSAAALLFLAATIPDQPS